MSVNKLVLKGTGKMSLHERFTQLSSQIVTQEIKPFSQPQPQFIRQSQISRQRTSHSTMRSYEYSPSTPRSRTPDQPRYAPRRRSESPVGRMSRPRNQPLRSPYGVSVRPSSTVLAANRIKKKSVYLRLGVRPSMSSGIPVWAEPYSPRQQNMGGMRSAQNGLSRSTSMNSLSRYNSNTSLHSFDIPRYQTPRRYGGYGGGGGAYGRFRGGRRPFNNFGRGGRRRFGRGRFGGGGGNWGRGRGRGRRGGGGGGGGRGQGRKQPPPNREELDKELESYMAGTRGLLDQEMDTYMANK